MSIAMDVLQIVREHLPSHPVRVTKIRLKVGKLTAVVPENFRFCMEAVSRDGPAQGAEIVIEEVPLVVECEGCGAQSELREPLFICPRCEGTGLKIISGRDLFIESIEIEDRGEEECADGS